MEASVMFIVLFISGFVKSKIVPQNSEHVAFDEFLNLFENCTVNLYNYKGLQLWISKTPVIMHSETIFRIEYKFRNQAKIPDHCITAIYIMPTSEYNYSESSNDFDDFNRVPKVTTELRYDIFLTTTSRKSESLWKYEFFDMLVSGRQSNGLILQISNNFEQSLVSILNKIEIVNQFHLSPFRPLVTITTELKPMVSKGMRKNLDQAVSDVNDFSKNKDIKWSLKYDMTMPNFPPDMPIKEMIKILESQDGKRIRQDKWVMNRMRGGSNMSPSGAQFLVNSFGKDAENYIFAFLLLGSDVKLQEFEGYSPQTRYFETRPTITFDVPNGQILKEEIRRDLGFISCSKFGGPIYKPYTILEVVLNLLAVFEMKVYHAGILSYLLPAVLLGILYHCMLKKRIKKEYQITWHPFTWGLRALIWQAGDRKINSFRFGWTTFLVIPWLLVSVILSHVFRQNVLRAIGPSGRLIYPRNPIKAMYDSGVTLMTDNYRLGRFVPQLVSQIVDWRLMSDLRRNSSIAFVGWMDDIEKIAGEIGWGCGNTWGPPKTGRLSTWDFYFLSERYIYGLETTLVRGWTISNWVDNKILERLKVLEGPSGIVAKWRKVLKSSSGNNHWRTFKGINYVHQISLIGSILYLFYCEAGALVGALIMFIAEWVFYAVYTRPRQKRKREMEFKRKRKFIEEMQVKSDSERGSVSSGEVSEEGFLEQTVENTEEEELRIAPTSSLVAGEKISQNEYEQTMGRNGSEIEGQSLNVNTVLEQNDSSQN